MKESQNGVPAKKILADPSKDSPIAYEISPRNPKSFGEITNLSHPASAILDISSGWLELWQPLCKERVEPVHQQFSDRLGGHRSQCDRKVPSICLCFKANMKGLLVALNLIAADFWGLGDGVMVPS